MRTALPRLFVVAAALLLVAGTPLISNAVDRPDDDDVFLTKREPPASVRWYCEPPNRHAIPPMGRGAGRHMLTYLRIDFKQTPWVGTLDTGYSRYLASTTGAAPHASVWFSYKLTVGEFVPMLDAMYKVTDLSARNIVELKRTTEKEFVKNLTQDRNLVVVPVGSAVRFNFTPGGTATWPIYTVVIIDEIVAGGAAEKPRVRISTNQPTGLRSNITRSEVAVGDTVPLVQNCQLTVKKIVPPDLEHKIVGWVEFNPIPAGQEGALCNRSFQQTFADADVGTDPAFEKLMADNHVRKGLVAPRWMRDMVTSRDDLHRIAGPVRVEARAGGDKSLFLWTFDADFRGDSAGGMPKVREFFARSGLQEMKGNLARYLSDLRKIRSHTVSDTSTIFGVEIGETLEEASITSPEQLTGGNVRAYRQNVLWALVGRWSGEPPTFRHLLDACPLLKSPHSEKALDAYMDDKPVSSYSTSFSDDAAAAGWRVETPAKLRPDLESLLRKLGFVESERTTHIWLPRDENGAEQHAWERPSDASRVTITPLGDNIEVGYQGPQRQK